MFETGKAAQEAREMSKYRIIILGLSESRYTGTLADGTTVLYLGRSDGQRQALVALTLDKSARKTLIDWTPAYHNPMLCPANEADQKTIKNHYHTSKQRHRKESGIGL